MKKNEANSLIFSRLYDNCKLIFKYLNKLRASKTHSLYFFCFKTFHSGWAYLQYVVSQTIFHYFKDINEFILNVIEFFFIFYIVDVVI